MKIQRAINIKRKWINSIKAKLNNQVTRINANI